MDCSRSPPPRIPPPSTKIAKSHRFKEIDAWSECCSLLLIRLKLSKTLKMNQKNRKWSQKIKCRSTVKDLGFDRTNVSPEFVSQKFAQWHFAKHCHGLGCYIHSSGTCWCHEKLLIWNVHARNLGMSPKNHYFERNLRGQPPPGPPPRQHVRARACARNLVMFRHLPKTASSQGI